MSALDQTPVRSENPYPYPADTPKLPEDIPPLGQPKSLTLRFSSAADFHAIKDLFNGPRKKQIDPKNFVNPRSNADLLRDVAHGYAVMAIDENDDIRGFALATKHDARHDGERDAIEVGGVMADAKQIGIGKILVSMLALKVQFNAHTHDRVYAKVARNNEASNGLFRGSMAWDQVENEGARQALFDLAYQNKPSGNRDRCWYHFNQHSTERALALLDTLATAKALHTKDGRSVAVDLQIPPYYGVGEQTNSALESAPALN